MHTSRRITMAVLFALVIASLIVAAPVGGEPQMQQNLIRNGGFEENSTAGWTEFQNPPSDNPGECYDDYWLGVYLTDHPSRVHSGGRALSYTIHWRTFQSGFYQQVSGVTPGATYRASAWGHMWSTNDPEDMTSDFGVQMRVGVNPNGGTNWEGSNVVWSSVVDARDAYQEMSVETVANSDTITVFIYARPMSCVYQSDAYWDDISLVLVSGAPADDGGGDDGGDDEPEAPAPGTWGVDRGAISCAEPRADGSVVHTVGQGEVFIGIVQTYMDCGYDISLESVQQLNNIANTRVIFVGQEITILPAGSAQPPPAEEPEPVDESGGDEPAEEEAGESAESAEESDDSATEPSAPAESTATTGTLCILAYEDVNADGLRDPLTEQPLEGVTFAVVDGSQQTVANLVTDGSANPTCDDFPSGVYRVSLVSDSHQATIAPDSIVELSAGSLTTKEFGVQMLTDDVAGEDDGGGREGRGLTTALIAAGGVLLLMVGIGAAVYFFVLRRPASDF